jgi:hypothetical protein
MRRRIAGLVAIGALIAASVAGLAGPAAGHQSARATTRNTRFCKVLQTQNQGDLANLSPDSAKFAIKQIDKLLKTNPPSKVKKALKKIKAAYKLLAEGESTTKVLAATGAISAFITFSSYVRTNCRTTTSSTTT